MTVDEAYAAMFLYLDAIYKRTHWDDIGTLLSGMDLVALRTTMDPAAWYDWEKAVAAVPLYMERLKKREQGDNSAVSVQ